jgi:hypothetical protein
MFSALKLRSWTTIAVGVVVGVVVLVILCFPHESPLHREPIVMKSELSPEAEAEAIKVIREEVKGGFATAEGIVLTINEAVVYPEEADEDWLYAEIEKAFAEKRAEQATWPEETDCDRLDRAFKSLDSQGIVALQNAGMTRSDGEDDAAEVYREAGGASSRYVGYCFYHGQDLERAVNGLGLFFAFGMFEDQSKDAEIGRRIQAALEQAGFKVEWNGTGESRLFVKEINWQRRSP